MGKGIVQQGANGMFFEEKQNQQTQQIKTTVTEQQLSLAVASELHEDWRRTRLQIDGTYEPRWKTIKDDDFIANLDKNNLPKNIRLENGIYEIDIANSNYSQLSKDWQKENFEAAKVVSNLVMETKVLGQEKTDFELGAIIHDKWLERNTWAKDDAVLSQPFDKLPTNEQLKDIAQYVMAEKKFDELQTQNTKTTIKENGMML